MAVLTTAAFLSKWESLFPSDGNRSITGARMREFRQDIADSFQSVAGATTITSWKDPCVVATTANITLSGEQTIDGVLTSASRVLVKNQATTSANGIYVSAAGAWSRATDADDASELEGAAVGVNQGTTNKNTVWLQTTDNVTLGSSAIAWQQVGYTSSVEVIDDDTFATSTSSNVASAESTKAYVDANTGTVYNTDLKYYEQDDFLIGSSSVIHGWFAQQNGTGASLNFSGFGCDSTENVIGSIYCGTGTTTAGRSAVSKGMGTGNTTLGVIFGNGHAFTLRMRCAVENLSDGTDTYTAYIGFGDTSGPGSHVDGVFFRYTHGTNSGKWQCVTSAASTETATDSTVAADTTFHIFEMQVNAAGTSAAFYIDGVLKATNTTNIPTGTNFTAMMIKIEKSAGTTERKLHMDYYDLLITRTTAR